MSTTYQTSLVAGFSGVPQLKEITERLGGDHSEYADFLNETADSLFDVPGEMLLKVCGNRLNSVEEDIQIVYNDDHDAFGLSIINFDVDPLDVSLVVSAMVNVLGKLIPELPMDKVKLFTMTDSF